MDKQIQVSINGQLFTLLYKHAKRLCALKTVNDKLKYARKHCMFMNR